MPSSPSLGGIDLSQLAASAGAETDRRNAGAKGALEASLASMLNEQGGMLAAQGEAQSRANTFARTQAMLAESMQRRAQGIQEQTARERAQAEADARGSQPNWYEQQRFQTDENIRQAKILYAMERSGAKADREAAAADDMPSLSDFGSDAINPYKGQAWEADLKRKGIDTEHIITPEQRDEVRALIAQYGADPALLTDEMQKYKNTFSTGSSADEIASYALWRLGYAPTG